MLLRTWIVYTDMVWLVLSSYNLDSLVPRLSTFHGGMCVESLGMRLQYGYMYIKLYTDNDTLMTHCTLLICIYGLQVQYSVCVVSTQFALSWF